LNEFQRNAINDLLADIELEKFTAKKFQKYEKALNQFIDTLGEAEKASLPKGFEDEVKRIGKRFATDATEVSTEELETILDAVEQQRNLSIIKSKKRKEAERREKKRAQKGVIEQAEGAEELVKEGFRGDEKVGVVEEKKNFADLFKLELLDRYVIADLIEKDKAGPVHQLLIDNFNEAERKKFELFFRVSDDVMGEVNKDRQLRKALDRKYNISDKLRVTGDQMLEIFIQLDNDKALADMTKGGIVRRSRGKTLSKHKLTNDEIENIRLEVNSNPKLLALGDRISSNLESMFTELNNMYKTFFGNRIDLIREDNYFPVDVAYEEIEGGDSSQDVKEYIKQVYGSSDYITFDRGILKPRIARGVPIFIDGATRSFISHANNVSDLVGFEPALRQANNVFNNNAVKKAVNNVYGNTNMMKTIRQFLKDVVGERTDPSTVSRAIGGMRRNLTTAYLGLSAPVVAKQALSLINTIDELGPNGMVLDLLPALTKLTANLSTFQIEKLAKDWEKRLPFLRDRFTRGFEINVRDIIDSQDILRSLGLKKGLSLDPATLRTQLLGLIRFTDKLTVLTVAEAAKNKVLRTAKNLNAQELDAAVNKEAENLIRRTQIAGSKLDRAGILRRKNEAVRMFTMFYGAESKILNNAIGRYHAEYKQGNKAKALARFSFLGVPMMMLNQLGSQGLTDLWGSVWSYLLTGTDDEDEPKGKPRLGEAPKKGVTASDKAAAAGLSAIANKFPVLREFAAPYIRSEFLGKPFNVNHPLFGALQRIGQRLTKKDKKKRKPKLGEIRKDVSTINKYLEKIELPAALLTGLPTMTVREMVELYEAQSTKE